MRTLDAPGTTTPTHHAGLLAMVAGSLLLWALPIGRAAILAAAPQVTGAPTGPSAQAVLADYVACAVLALALAVLAARPGHAMLTLALAGNWLLAGTLLVAAPELAGDAGSPGLRHLAPIAGGLLGVFSAQALLLHFVFGRRAALHGGC